jgi:hypothetical protein
LGLFDIFSSKGEKKAAAAQERAAQQGRDRSIAAVETGFGNARTTLADTFGDARSAVTAGRDAAKPLFGQARSEFDQVSAFADKDEATSSLLRDALGVNGDEGLARAKGAYSTSAGFDFAKEQGLEEARRAAAAGGMSASGNLVDEITKRAVGYASKDHGSWLDRLTGLDSQRLGALMGVASGRAGITQNEAGTEMDTGRTLASLFGQEGTSTANAFTGQATTTADIETGFGQRLGEAQARYATAGDKAGANIFGAVMGGLDMLGKFTGVGGFGKK